MQLDCFRTRYTGYDSLDGLCDMSFEILGVLRFSKPEGQSANSGKTIAADI